MMAQGAFLLYIKAHAGLTGHVPAQVVQTEKLSPSFLALYRSEKVGAAGGMLFTHRIPTGKIDKNFVEIHLKSWGFKISLTAAGIKTQLRRLRPQEAARLSDLDGQIVALETQLRIARQERKDLLREAFGKAHVVTVAELRQAAEAKATMEETVES